MTKLCKILFLLLIVGLSANSQSPVSFPTVNSPTGYYNIGWIRGDSGIINAVRDTTVRSKFPGLQVLWQNNGVDSNIWFYDGAKYFRYLKTATDVFNVIGGIPVMSLTTNGSSGPATLINGVLNIPQYSGGGGGGNIISLNGNTAAVQFLAQGTSGSDFNIVASGNNTITFNLPTAGPGVRGLLGTSDWAAFNAKQSQLNGTGFVKASGTTISYDNTTYYAASNPNGYINYSQLSALAPVLYNNLTGVISADTTPGLTHFATQAYANAHGGGSGITVVGNLSPLFNSTVITNTLSFSFINAGAFNVLGNFTGSPAAPTYGLITVNNMAAIAGNRLLGNPNGSAATPSLIPLGFGLKFVGGALAFDSATVKDTVFAVEGLSAYGVTGDSIGMGGRFYQNAVISGANLYDLTYDSFPAGTNRGFRVNFGSDAGWDVFVRDSATGRWTRIPKGAIGTVLGRPSTGGIGWVAQTGGGGSNLTDTTIYATVSNGATTYSSGLTSTVIVNVAYNGVIVPGVAHTGYNSYSYNSGTGVFTFTGITFSTGDNLQITYRAVGSGGGGGSCSGCLINTNNLSDVTNANTSLNNLLPTQTSNAGKVLGTNGTNTSWVSAGSRNLTPVNITSGVSSTLAQGNVAVYFDPSSTISTYGLTTPASPSDGDEIWITGGGTLTGGPIVTTLTLIGNGSQSVPLNYAATLGFQQSIAWRYRLSNTTWYRFQ